MPTMRCGGVLIHLENGATVLARVEGPWYDGSDQAMHTDDNGWGGVWASARCYGSKEMGMPGSAVGFAPRPRSLRGAVEERQEPQEGTSEMGGGSVSEKVPEFGEDAESFAGGWPETSTTRVWKLAEQQALARKGAQGH